MATKTDVTLSPTNTSDATFRAWVQFVHDTFITTGGWVDPGDSGQFTISTATHPSTTLTKVGYRMYRMADTLQATYPVYIRVDYGSFAAATQPGMWLTIGTGSNGSGTITGVLWNGGGSSSPNISLNTPSVTVCNSYSSADTNRIHLGMFIQSNSGLVMVLSIERTKDTSGNDTGDGLLLCYTSGASSTCVNKSRYIVWAGGSQPTEEAGLNYALSRQNPSSFGGSVGVGLLLHFKGTVVQPGLGVCVVRSNDITTEGAFSISVYGHSRTYQALYGAQAHSQSNTQDANTRVCIRFD